MAVYLPIPEEEADPMPIMFINRAGKIDTTEPGMISAYIFDWSFLNLEDAARMAADRDERAALDLLSDFIDINGAVLSTQ